jgi:hypothetical protein
VVGTFRVQNSETQRYRFGRAQFCHTESFGDLLRTVFKQVQGLPLAVLVGQEKKTGKSKNQGYTESAWSSMMCNIFKEKTGMNISINCLRSSFITYFYDSDDSANLTLRESIAHGMRHSIVEAQKTYDKRTRQEKKRKGVDWCGNNTMKYLGEDFVPAPPTKVIKKRPTKDQSYNDSEPHSHIPSINDVVAVSFKNDADEPTFWLGKCLRVNTENNTLLLGWFQEIESNRYKMKIGASWEEVCIILLQYL